MKIVGIFNKKEEEVGFRLSGIDSKYVKTTDNLTKLLNELKQNNNIGILVISKDIYNLLPEEFDKIQKQKLPLLLKLILLSLISTSSLTNGIILLFTTFILFIINLFSYNIFLI